MRSRLVLATIIVGGAVLAACSPCKDTVSITSVSPDGKWVAASLVRDCGATESEVTWITLSRKEAVKVNDPSNLVATIRWRRRIEFVWSAEDKLSIECYCKISEMNARVYVKDGVNVVFNSKLGSQPSKAPG